MSADKYVVITSPFSSGEMYLEEAAERGYKPIALIPYIEGINVGPRINNMIDKMFEGRALVIHGPKEYDDLVKILEPYNIVGVFAGSESGVKSAEVLSKMLDLPGNDPETTALRDNKYGMYLALKKNGLRRIETRKITSVDEITEFWNEYCKTGAVLKFTESGASVGVKLCYSLPEAIDYYKTMGNVGDYLGRTGGEIVMQELIGGTEYMVDTVSYGGKHIVVSIWHTEKRDCGDNNTVYRREETISYDNPVAEEIIDYALKVLDAVDIKYGPCQTELNYDEKGPVLMETNPRLHGTGLPRDYLKKMSGHCIVDTVLDLMEDPSKIDEIPPRIPEIKAGLTYMLMLTKAGLATTAPFSVIAPHIEGYSNFKSECIEVSEYRKTVDLQTCAGFIYLVGDRDRLNKTFDKLDVTNQRYPDLFFWPGEIHANEDIDRSGFDPGSIISDAPHHFICGSGKHDAGVFAVTDSPSLAEWYAGMFELMSRIEKGGRMLIPNAVYSAIPYGKDGIEAIANLIGMRHEFDDDVFVFHID